MGCSMLEVRATELGQPGIKAVGTSQKGRSVLSITGKVILQFSEQEPHSLSLQIIPPPSNDHRDWLQGDRNSTQAEPVKVLISSGKNGGPELSDVGHLGTLCGRWSEKTTDNLTALLGFLDPVVPFQFSSSVSQQILTLAVKRVQINTYINF